MAFGCSVLSVLAAQGPSESAIDFIRKLTSGNVDLAPQTDTAIVAEISPGKMESIQQRLQRLALDLNREQIEIGPIRTEGSLAGVIVRRMDPADPMMVRILPLTMVRTGEKWRPGPVPASFENTAATFSRSSRTIARQLEDWLVCEQAQEIERFRKSAGLKLRQSLADSVSPESIRKWTAQEAFSAFMDACDRRETSSLLALTGGLSDPLPDDWQQLAHAIRTSLSSASPGVDTWSLLTSPEVVRFSNHESGTGDGTHTFRVVFLDPRSEGEEFLRVQTVTVRRDAQGLWRIKLPDTGAAVLDEESSLGESATLSAQRHPPRPSASAVELKYALLVSLRAPQAPYSCLELIQRDNRTAADLLRLKNAVRIRWETMNPARPVIPMELGYLEESDYAFLAMQWLSLERLAYSPRVFHLQKNPGGWVWNTSPDKSTRTSAEIWLKKMEKAWKESYLEQAVHDCAMPDFMLPSPEEPAVSSVVGNWLEALSKADCHHALSFCARLQSDKSPTLLLRNLGYECKAITPGSQPHSVEILHRGKTVTLAAIYPSKQNRSIQSLLPVVSTRSGARILMEIDLGDPSRPGRAFLNRNAIDRLTTAHAGAAKELAGMISQHLDGGPK